MNVSALEKAQQSVALLKEAVTMTIVEGGKLNTSEIGRLLNIDSLGGVEQKGHVTRAILFEMKKNGLIDTEQTNPGAEHHWHLVG